MTIKIKQTGAVYTEGSSINSPINIGGSTTQVQFNDEGVFAGDSGLTYNKTTDALTITGDLAVNGGDLTTSAVTFNLLNVTATTLNIGGAATTVEIGAATGTTSINNALTVDGNTTLGNATSDTTTIAGSLAVNGTSAASTNKITSTQTSFDLLNTTVTTLNVGGAATAIEIGAATGTTSINNALTVDGDTTLGNATSDTTTIAGSLAVNGTAAATTNKITSTQTSFDLLNSTVTTLNIGGAATTVEIGAATGTTSINNALTVDGNTTLGDATSDTTTIAGSLAVNGTSAAGTNKITSTQTSFDLLNEPTTLNIGSTAVTRTINIATGAAVQTVNIGTGAAANIISVGSTTGGASLTLQAGTGNLALTGATTTTYTVGSALGTGTLTLGRSTAANSILIGAAGTNTAVTQAINIGGGSGLTSITLGASTGASSLTLDAGTGDINIGTGGGARTTNIATTQTGTQTINIGTLGTNTCVIRIGNYGSTVISTTTIYGDELILGGISSDKIGFFGTAPIIKPTIGGSNFTANAGTAMNSASTSTGGSGASAYTFAGIVRALKDLGLITT